MNYNKKAIRVKAIRWTGDNLIEVSKLIANKEDIGPSDTVASKEEWDKYIKRVKHHNLDIHTRFGALKATVGDMIVREGRDVYPCNYDTFQETYDKVSKPLNVFELSFLNNIFRTDKIDLADFNNRVYHYVVEQHGKDLDEVLNNLDTKYNGTNMRGYIIDTLKRKYGIDRKVFMMIYKINKQEA